MKKTQNNFKACDLENIFIDKDFISWTEELNIVTVEIEFCQNLFISILNDVDASYQSKYNNIIEKLRLLKNENNQIKKELFALGIQFEGYVECQDMQCDNYYMVMHLAFRDRIEQHFSIYSKLKKKLLLKINKENPKN
ncbi:MULTISPECIES: hypothetical protein [unclassified Flavobacterium]|uniref:hypothetical protein n=1 Tax=unclassified Flavobacterium TaxID=196869 RepID=UPI000EAFB7E3|nr:MULTISPECIES: hypothetical protein [unclassified Flavobacterium]RKS03149.1 hypothetical protein C8C84_2891 [Flavobacterium sp. 102]